MRMELGGPRDALRFDAGCEGKVELDVVMYGRRAWSVLVGVSEFSRRARASRCGGRRIQLCAESWPTSSAPSGHAPHAPVNPRAHIFRALRTPTPLARTDSPSTARTAYRSPRPD
jgi:hypothetical protein